MLKRSNYYDNKRKEIKAVVIEIIEKLMEMTEHFKLYLAKPTKENKKIVLKNESFVDRYEEKLKEDILEIISLQQLEIKEIEWLLMMNRIIRELERVGDQLTNIITFSDAIDISTLQEKTKPFLKYGEQMMIWLGKGIQNDDPKTLQDVIQHDEHINVLNKETYQHLVHRIHEQEELTETRIKMIIISRFLERLGDHLVNAAEMYKEYTEQNR